VATLYGNAPLTDYRAQYLLLQVPQIESADFPGKADGIGEALASSWLAHRGNRASPAPA
jgi:hypothetical protein